MVIQCLRVMYICSKEIIKVVHAAADGVKTKEDFYRGKTSLCTAYMEHDHVTYCNIQCVSY